MNATLTRRLQASDVSGQKLARINACEGDVTISELVSNLLSQMQLPANDVEGRPVSYQARLDREGRALLGSETVQTLQDDDLIVLQPNVDAGAAS